MCFASNVLAKTSRFRLALVALALLIAGCTSEDPPAKGHEPIVGRPPYLCQVIPADAPHLLYPVEGSSKQGAYQESRFSDSKDAFGDNEYICTLKPTEKSHPGQLSYRQFRSSMADEIHENLVRLAGRSVSSDSGVGLLNIDSIAPTGWVYWRCNDDHVLSEISYKKGPGTEERNAREDLTALLRIAQKRFAEIENCEIKPVRS